MAQNTHTGATAPRASRPNENARWRPGVGGRHGTENTYQYAKTTATAIARAALLGIEARLIGADVWLLRHAGGEIGVVNGLPALIAALGGFERAVDNVGAGSSRR